MTVELAKTLVIHNELEDCWFEPAVEHEVEESKPGHYAFSYLDSKDETCVFISCTDPLETNTRVRLKFNIDEGTTSLLEIEGEVIWRNKFDPSNLNNLDPGMAIRFDSISKIHRAQIYRHLKTFVFLDREAMNKTMAS